MIFCDEFEKGQNQGKQNIYLLQLITIFKLYIMENLNLVPTWEYQMMTDLPDQFRITKYI